MIYLAYGMVATWFSGAAIFAVIVLNDIRLVLNNLASDRNIWKSGKTLDYSPTYIRFRIDAYLVAPEDLTETGRQYQKRARRHCWMMFAWMVLGFFLTAAVFSYAQGR